MNVTVAKVKFSESTNQRNGYDDYDTPATRVVIVRNMKSYYYLSAAAAVGDTTARLTADSAFNYPAGSCPLGTGASQENVTVASSSGSTITLGSPLTKAHTAGEPLEFPASGSSSDPILVTEGSSSLDILKWTIPHEFLMRPAIATSAFRMVLRPPMKLTLSMIPLASVLTVQSAICQTTENPTMPTNAQDYIAAFRRGEDFAPPAKGVFVGDQPDAAALQLLGQELAVAKPAVRENLVKLLVDMGLRTDPLTPKGTEVLRHPEIVELLARPGLARPDMGREAAMDALRTLVAQPDLAPFENAFVKALSDAPTEEAFLLVAKAKSQKAKTLVDRLANSSEWKNVEAAKIARAALGDQDVENEFLAAADVAQDGKALAQALGSLALIGTPRSLRAIAKRLRTPLTIEVPGALEKSLRLNVLEALLYNFPDQPVLYPNNIIREADYTAAERFCTQALGVTYKDPSPPFLTYRGRRTFD
ncbi:MAG: hypothetical protein IPK13_04520 [Deltaproteobacteria bacterium]|nr:hypothetical protein [Deltaproteobacteria bacterium]